MEMKEQITQEEAAARGIMEAEYDQLAELVTALQANPGDDRAFEKFYELTYPRILYTARSLVNSEQSALDVAQEVYLAFYKNLANIRQPRAIVSWLHRTATGKAKDMRERASAQNETLLQSEKQEYVFTNTEEHRADFVPHEQMDARATREIISEMLTELPAEQSQTLVYRFVEGLPLAEIAEIMDCTVSTVKSRLKYGKAKIEEQVTAMEKKGIKLYSTSIPMLLACLRGLLAQRGSLSAAEAGGLLVKVRAAVSAAAAAASASSSAAAHTAAHSAATKAGTAAAVNTGGAAAAAKASSSAVGVKIVAGLLVAAMAAGGAVAVPKAAHQVQEKQVEQQTQSAEELAAVQADYDQNTAYLNVISELQEQFGERTDISRNAYSGLLTAKLVDFDGDGEDELFCIYNDGSIRNSVGNTDGVNIGSWFSVYSWDGERANRVTWGPLYHNKTYRVSWHATYTLPTGGCYLYKKEGDPKTYLCWPIVSTYEIDENNDSNRTVMGISDWMREYTIEDGEWKAVSDISATRDLNTGAITNVGSGTAAEGDVHWTPQKAEEELSAIRRDGEYFRSTFFHDGTDYSLSGEDAYIFQAAKKIPYYPQTPANGFEPPETPDALIQSLQAQAETDKQQLGDSFREYTEPAKTPEQLKATAEDAINEGLEWDNVYYYELGSATNSQVGMNYAAGRTDYWWQHTCLVLMDCLKQTLSANEYSVLEQEQQAWEKQAEQQAEAAGMEAAGGSAQKMLIWDKSGELYQERAMQLKDKLAQVLGMTIES